MSWLLTCRTKLLYFFSFFVLFCFSFFILFLFLFLSLSRSLPVSPSPLFFSTPLYVWFSVFGWVHSGHAVGADVCKCHVCHVYIIQYMRVAALSSWRTGDGDAWSSHKSTQVDGRRVRLKIMLSSTVHKTCSKKCACCISSDLYCMLLYCITLYSYCVSLNSVCEYNRHFLSHFEQIIVIIL